MSNKIIVIIVALILLMSTMTLAIGLGISPSKLDYKKVLKGGFSQKTVLISTDTVDELTVFLEKQGEVSEWIGFGSMGENIEDFTVTKNSPFLLRVRIQPPNNVQNGNYTGYIRVVTDKIQNMETGKGSAVKAAFMININVEIVGDEIVNCIAGGLDIRSFEIGEELPLSYTIENTGNVLISPDVEIKLSDNEGNDVNKMESSSDSLLPTLKNTYTQELSNKLKEGQYFANIKVPLCNANQVITFNVVGPGGISDTGELLEITNPIWGNTDDILPITATFKNTGARNVRAKFVGTIKDVGGKVVKLIDTDYLTVAAGETERFQTFFKPNDPGQYFVNGKINFNNKITFEKMSILNINEGTGETSDGFNWTALIIIGIIVSLMLIIIKKKKILLKKKHHKKKIKFKF